MRLRVLVLAPVAGCRLQSGLVDVAVGTGGAAGGEVVGGVEFLLGVEGLDLRSGKEVGC